MGNNFRGLRISSTSLILLFFSFSCSSCSLSCTAKFSDYSLITVFVEQPLALPGSAKLEEGGYLLDLNKLWISSVCVFVCFSVCSISKIYTLYKKSPRSTKINPSEPKYTQVNSSEHNMHNMHNILNIHTMQSKHYMYNMHNIPLYLPI